MRSFRERFEAEEEREGQTDEGVAPLNALANFLKFQGVLIAHLALNEDTGEELVQASVHAADRVPAWMEMRVFQRADDPPRQFTLGCVQLLKEQRTALERIAEEQVDDAEPIELLLARGPLPEGSESESNEEMLGACSVGLSANFQATLAIARDLDEWIEEEMQEAEARAKAAGVEVEGTYEDLLALAGENLEEYEEYLDEDEDDEDE